MDKRIYLKDTASYIRLVEEDRNHSSHIIEIADMACDNIFIFKERYEMEKCVKPVHFDGQIDWNLVPFGDNEWCFAFNRHTFLLNLAKAYALTGDEKYRASWIRLFEDFYDRTAPEGESAKLCWRTLESGIRIENYIRSLEFFNDTKPLEEKTMEKMKALMEKHIEWLTAAHDDFHRLSNWGVLQDHGLLLAGLCLDDSGAVRTALERLSEELTLQTMDDGIHWEQSTMYQAEVLHASLDSILACRRTGTEVPQRLCEKAHLLATGLAAQLRPDGKCYLFGDSDEIDMRDLVLEAAVIFNDGNLAWAGRGGNDTDFYASFPTDTPIPSPVPTEDRSRFFPDTGNAILSLSEDAEVRFHCGLYGSGHGHFDQLNFDLYLNNEVLFTDKGRYTYVDSPERRALKGTEGHNTIIVDDREMATMVDSWAVRDFAEPIFHDAKVEGNVKFVSASHLGYMPLGILTTRSILTLGSDTVLIFDTVQGPGSHRTRTLFNTDEGASVTRVDEGCIKVEKNRARASIHFLTPAEVSIKDSVMSKHYNEMLDMKAIVAEGTFTGKCLNVYLISLSGTEPEIERLDVTKPLSGKTIDDRTAFGLRVKTSSGDWTVSYADTEIPHDGFLTRTGDADAFARVFVKREGEETRVIKF